MSISAVDPRPARTALVTGASRGIGRHLALALAGAGVEVALLARDRARLQEVASEIESRGQRALVLTADVTDSGAVTEAVATAEEALGSIDLLVNNAGLVDAEVPLWEADPHQVHQVLEVNVFGAFLLARAVVPGMLKRGGGRVIDLNSGAGTRDMPAMAGYNMAKTALFRIGGGLHEAGYQRGLRAFELAPGVVATDMTAAMAMHEGRTDWTPPEAVAEIVTALAAGELDTLSGCYLRAGTDTIDELRARAATPAGTTETGHRLAVTDWAGPTHR
ncbi:SDR family NAD(P)-dependent oxidoreductase [Ruania halotolerans]|uniref:SDR family NAD(P)-dependent oxidoreductase n=1 Tax=Ruania halotolerans TaxID=2897773 RepID=UPI001E5EC70A|nr:SDR family oxidoreductase [Ruania halotolerans]UFU07142.1 SDR family oxidoreductase [Ruania halotolerans]